jgi:hypothetical protein
VGERAEYPRLQRLFPGEFDHHRPTAGGSLGGQEDPSEGAAAQFPQEGEVAQGFPRRRPAYRRGLVQQVEVGGQELVGREHPAQGGAVPREAGAEGVGVQLLPRLPAQAVFLVNQVQYD